MNDQDGYRASCLPVACTRQHKISKPGALPQTNRPGLPHFDHFCRILPVPSLVFFNGNACQSGFQYFLKLGVTTFWAGSKGMICIWLEHGWSMAPA